METKHHIKETSKFAGELRSSSDGLRLQNTRNKKAIHSDSEEKYKVVAGGSKDVSRSSLLYVLSFPAVLTLVNTSSARLRSSVAPAPAAEGEWRVRVMKEKIPLGE